MEVRDGLIATGRQTEVRLIDPTDCPAGHRFTFGMRHFDKCQDQSHHGHSFWQCSCGQLIYRWPGRFSGEPLECLAAGATR